MNVLSGNIASIKNNIPKNIQNSRKLGKNQFVLLRTLAQYDFEGPKNLFTKYPKKQLYNQHNPQNLFYFDIIFI